MKRSTNKKRGRPPLIDPEAPAVSVSRLKWWTYRLVQDGHSADAIAHAFRRVFGERVCADAIREWRRTAFTDASKLLKK